MVRPPRFSESAAEFGLRGWQWADEALVCRRYCPQLLLVNCDDRPWREWAFLTEVVVFGGSDRLNWRLFALDFAAGFSLVIVGSSWQLPTWSTLPVLKGDGVVVDERTRRVLTVSDLEVSL